MRGVFHRFPRACWGDSDGWFVVAGHHGRKASEIELPATVLYRPDAAPVEPRTLPTEAQAKALLAPLRELYHSKTYVCTHLRNPGELGPCCRHEICDACNQMHPCPTIRMLDQIEAEGGRDHA